MRGSLHEEAVNVENPSHIASILPVSIALFEQFGAPVRVH